MTDDDHPDRAHAPGGGADHDGRPHATGGAQEPVGSVGEEAAKLLGVLSQWAREQAPQDEHTGHDRDHHGHAHVGDEDGAPRSDGTSGTTDAAECRWCPLCRAVHVVRQTSPEVRQHLTQAASSLVQAAAGLLATHAGAHTGAPAQGGSVQKIDLDDETEWDEDR